MNRLREWWNRWHDLPKIRGGNFSLIPMEVRDISHESYDAWASFVTICTRNPGVVMGPRATLIAWCSYLGAWRYHRNIEE